MSTKLQSFLKRRLNESVYSDVRWCEAILLRRGDQVTFCHVAVTSEVIYIADLANKSLKNLMDIKSINSLSLETDKAEFLSGVVQEQSLHILLRVKDSNSARQSNQSKRISSTKEDRRAKALENRRRSSSDVIRSGEGTHRLGAPEEEGWSIKDNQQEAASEAPVDGTKKSKYTLSSFLKKIWDGQSYHSKFSSEGKELNATSPPASPSSPRSPPTPISPGFNSISSNFIYPQSPNLSNQSRIHPHFRRASSTSLLTPNHSRQSLPGTPNPSFLSPNSVIGGSCTSIIPIPVSPSTSCTRLCHTDRFFTKSPVLGNEMSHHSSLLPNVSSSHSLLTNSNSHYSPLLTNGGSQHISLLANGSSLFNPLSNGYSSLNHQPNVRKVTPPSPGYISSPTRSLCNRTPVHYEASLTDIATLRDSSQCLQRSCSALDTRYTPDVPDRRSYSVLEGQIFTPKRYHKPRNPPEQEKLQKEAIYHLYTITANSLLYKILHTLWRNMRLSRSRQNSDAIPLDSLLSGSSEFRSYFSTEEGGKENSYLVSLEEDFWQLKAQLLSAKTLKEKHFLIKEIICGLNKFAKIKILFWQDSTLVVALTNLLKRYLCSQSSVKEHHDSVSERHEELEFCVSLYRALTDSLYASHQHIIKVLSRSNYKPALCLLSALLTPACVPPSVRITCDRWLKGALSYSEEEWEILPQGPLIKLVARNIEVSSMAAHKLLLLLNEEPSNTLKLSDVFKSCSLKPWLKYAAPQLFSLLNAKAPPPDGSDSLQQYLSIFSIILENSAQARRYFRRHYREEVTYIVTDNNLHRQLPDNEEMLETSLHLSHNIKNILSL